MNPIPGDQLLSTHAVGALLQVDPSSVVKWMNDGLLPAFRTPGGHRRVRADALLAFLREHGMFIPPELAGGSRRKVLFVDDDEKVVSAVARGFKTYADKVELFTATNGIEALVAVGAHHPDALITDLRMPELDGLEVCRRLKADPQYAKLDIVLFSGAPSVELERRAIEAGARALICKPLSAAGLMRVLGLEARAIGS